MGRKTKIIIIKVLENEKEDGLRRKKFERDVSYEIVMNIKHVFLLSVRLLLSSNFYFSKNLKPSLKNTRQLKRVFFFVFCYIPFD